MIGDWSFVHVERVHLLWALLAVIVVLGWLELRRRDMLRTFLSPLMARRLANPPSTGRTVAKLGLLFLALAFVVLALMRPQRPGRREAIGAASGTADVMFVLDVSKSMLAEDTAPNRLTRAKAEIGQMVDRLGPHRVGLIAFAGRAVAVCPLTPDHGFFHVVLSDVSTSTVQRGGTRIGDAVRAAVRGFPSGPGAKLIVLITDGEDHESFPLDAAKAAKDAGVHIVAVGLGSEAGAPLIITNPKTGSKEEIKFNGAPVVSKLDGATLREMTATTDGVYVPAGTGVLDLDAIVATHVVPMIDSENARTIRTIPVEYFPQALLVSMLLLCAALWIGSSRDARST